MNTFRPHLIAAAVSVASAMLATPAAAAAAGYAPLTNTERGAAQCLTWRAGSDVVEFAACNGSAAQDWKLEVRANSFHYIKNAEAAARGHDYCLKTDYDTGGRNEPVVLGQCDDKDDTDGFDYMRMWTAGIGVDGRLVLRNFYRDVLGQTEYLSALPDGRVAMQRASKVGAQAIWHHAEPVERPSIPLVGNKSALLMVAHFDGTRPNDPKAVRDAVFGNGDDPASLVQFLKFSSRGKLKLSGKTLENVSLGKRPATCDADKFLSSARKAALKQGVNPDDYDYLFLSLPAMSELPACDWLGLAQAQDNWIIMLGDDNPYRVWAHEFGHTFGADHSGSVVRCPTEGGTVKLGDQCREGDVDDPADPMGGGGARPYPVSYLQYNQWLERGDAPVVRDAGTYALKPAWSQAGGAKAYRIDRNDGSELWLEFHQPTPVYNERPASDPFVNGVIVRTMRYDTEAYSSSLVDTTPRSSGGMKDAPLMPGHALHDTLSGKIITVRSAGPDGAVIDVRNDGQLLPQAMVTGPQHANARESVTLSGATSIGDRLTYRWTVPDGIDAKQDGSTLRFVAPAHERDREYVFRLSVTNGNGYSAATTHQVKVKAEELVAPPKASISGPAVAKGGERVKLSGASSTGKELTYRWSGPAGLAIDQNGVDASFVAPKAAEERRYDVKLTVTDAQNRSAAATHRVTVRADAVAGAPAWDPKKTYATPCEKVSHRSKTWLNGWWVLGDEPGTGGEWGAWREQGNANMHTQCKG
ncbi:carbohydrate-binding protein [Burkholderia sp. BCC1644]|uniref:carbohydrate-binding protein n=1 Tax=Burkholderia sp. BCC1644 TaxID=2676293 RepID=UPI001590C4EF|nr:carbohydrate-binding protein [Burkholderia sp. BCC1644]